jgi:hypothetical protein
MRHVSSKAGIYDARKAVAAVPHGPDFYNPNNKENKGEYLTLSLPWVGALLVVSITVRHSLRKAGGANPTGHAVNANTVTAGCLSSPCALACRGHSE